MIPPSPAVIGFDDWKLNTPMSPIAPDRPAPPRRAVRLRGVLDDPQAVAWAAAITPSMSAGEPP